MFINMILTVLNLFVHVYKSKVACKTRNKEEENRIKLLSLIIDFMQFDLKIPEFSFLYL